MRQLEGEIANSRKYYNAVVKTYNTKREVFPSVIIAGMFGFEIKPFSRFGTNGERSCQSSILSFCIGRP